MIKKIQSLIFILLVVLITSCSTTKNLPEGEVLYRGIRRTNVENQDKSNEGEFALGEARGALAYKPNNSLFGSSSITWWPPIGLWIYNAFKNSERGLGRWIFNKLAADPVLISTVNPELRTNVAQNLLRDYGYMHGNVSYEIDTLKNDRKAKIIYNIDMGNAIKLDSIMYQNFPSHADSLIRANWNERIIRDGNNLSIVPLGNERQRLSSLFRNNGYFYFRPEYITYLADTLINPGRASIKVVPDNNLPSAARRQWYIGKTSVFFTGYDASLPTDSLLYRDMMVHYNGDKPGIRPSVLYRRLRFHRGDLYSQQRQLQSQENLNRLNVFRYSEFQYTPRDTTNTTDTLDVQLNAAFDLPLDGELEVNFTSKSNDLIGPGAVFSVTKRNAFRGGETFSVSLRGSYEWGTNSSIEGNKADINSYELGISSSVNFPWIVFPWLHKRNFNYPANTIFRLYADLMHRARYFSIYSFGGNATYNLQPNIRSKHSFTPFRLTYNLLNATDSFRNIMNENRALYQSMQSQFVPALSYTYTYDNGRVPTVRNHLWWETTFTSAGNLLSGIYVIAGKGFNTQEKKFLGNPFAQFLKLTSEVRYNITIDRNQSIATRFLAGAVYSYGNARSAPYNEQFFIGGANSIRAFTVRSIGPGSYSPRATNQYSYLDQTGDFRLEANVEYRFRVVGDLKGAVFVDAGNIWLLREDSERPGGKFQFSGLGKEIALGTGLGLRYDLDFLVVRFDVGVPIHAPYDTGKSGYYNIPKFFRGLSYHLAIGYPF